jgi:hypothetical protein
MSMVEKEKVSKSFDAVKDDAAGGLFLEMACEIDYVAKPYKDARQRTVYPIESYTPTDKRLIVRSIFAFIEGVIFQLKQLALMAVAEKPGLLKPEEIAVAREEDYELDDSGKITMTKAKLRFRANFRFAFGLIIKANNVDPKYMPDFGSHEWEILCKAIAIRDRITHPKTKSDLVISENEIRDTLRAYDWVYSQVFLVTIRVFQQATRNRGKMNSESK